MSHHRPWSGGKRDQVPEEMGNQWRVSKKKVAGSDLCRKKIVLNSSRGRKMLEAGEQPGNCGNNPRTADEGPEEDGRDR